MSQGLSRWDLLAGYLVLRIECLIVREKRNDVLRVFLSVHQVLFQLSNLLELTVTCDLEQVSGDVDVQRHIRQHITKHQRLISSFAITLLNLYCGRD